MTLQSHYHVLKTILLYTIFAISTKIQLLLPKYYKPEYDFINLSSIILDN